MNKINIHIIPKVNDFARLHDFAKENGLKWEHNDFFLPELLDDRKAAEERIEFYKPYIHKGEDTLHGVFFDVLFDSREKAVRELSMMRAQSSMAIAKELGCKGVVFHTNMNPWITDAKYCDRWVEMSAEAYARLLSECPEEEIYIENMFDSSPELLRKLLDKLNDTRFNCCLDTSHVELSKTPLDAWFDMLGDRVKHVHINDNNKKDDSHLALGDGVCDIERALERVRSLPNVESILLEVNGMDKIEKSFKVISEVM